MLSATNVPSSHPSSKTLSARLAPLSRALCVSRSILPRISLSPPQPPKRPVGCGQGSALTRFVQLRTEVLFRNRQTRVYAPPSRDEAVGAHPLGDAGPPAPRLRERPARHGDVLAARRLRAAGRRFG